MKNFKAMGAAQARKQSGFTIIELVVVILLLGILTATALPRFLDISTEAHNAVVDAVEGSLRTGGALYRANWYAENQPTGVVGGTDWGSTFPNTTSGYPAAPAGGVDDNTIDLSTECQALFVNLLQGGAPTIDDAVALFTTTTPADTDDYTVTDTDLADAGSTAFDFVATNTSDDNCTFTYIADSTRLTVATAPNLTYNATTGVWTRTN